MRRPHKPGPWARPGWMSRDEAEEWARMRAYWDDPYIGSTRTWTERLRMWWAGIWWEDDE